MFSPIKWLQPRLKQFCIIFGILDMILVVTSIIGWYFFFSISFEAQHYRPILEYQESQLAASTTINPVNHRKPMLRTPKEGRTLDDLRIERIQRACRLDSYKSYFIDEDFVTSASLIGASLGCYFILGALLASLIVVEWHGGQKVLCMVCIFGETLSTLFILFAVVILFANQGLCPTEYYVEDFQPVLYLLVFTLMFIFSYKIYEMTVIVWYFIEGINKVAATTGEVETEVMKEFNVLPTTDRQKRKSSRAYEQLRLKPKTADKAVQVGHVGEVYSEETEMGNRYHVRDMTRGKKLNKRKAQEPGKTSASVGCSQSDLATKGAQSLRGKQEKKVDASCRPRSSRSVVINRSRKSLKMQKSKKLGTTHSRSWTKRRKSERVCATTPSLSEAEECETCTSQDQDADSPMQLPPGICPCHLLQHGFPPQHQCETEYSVELRVHCQDSACSSCGYRHQKKK